MASGACCGEQGPCSLYSESFSHVPACGWLQVCSCWDTEHLSERLLVPTFLMIFIKRVVAQAGLTPVWDLA